jgi:hypothetical protein
MSSATTAGDRVSDPLDDAVDAFALRAAGSMPPAEAAESLVSLRRSIDRLEGEFARLAAVVSESGEWKASGASSMPAWLSRTTGMARGRAGAAVELGEAMSVVPALDQAVRSGELSPASAAAVIPAIDDDGFRSVAELLISEIAGTTPSAAQRRVESWRAVNNPANDTERRRTAHDARTLTFRPLGDGMTHIEGVIPNETARSLRLALSHLAEQQRLDGSGRTRVQRQVDALGDLAAAYNRGEVTGGRNLPRIVVTMAISDLLARCGVGRDTFTGEIITSTEIDRMCCDAMIHRYVADQSGVPLNFGRGRRTASPNQFLAMVARDQGCRHPGCDRPPQWCEAHHLREFAARGGLTNLDEMVLLCQHHHHALHDDGWVLAGDPVHLTFTGPAGQRLDSFLPRSLPRHETKKAA